MRRLLKSCKDYQHYKLKATHEPWCIPALYKISKQVYHFGRLLHKANTMPLARLTQQFMKLPSYYKYIGIGSFILAVSTILPWYSDLDQYKIGDIFLGLTGPASFVGIVILLISILSFGIFLTNLLERRKIRLPVRECVFQLFVGVESLFLLLVTNSIYFHPKFGVNILLKEVRFGMVMAVLGAILVTIGGYFQHKKEKETDDMIGKLEPLVNMPVKEEKPRGLERERTLDIERKHIPLQTKMEAKPHATQEPLIREEPSAASAEPTSPEPPRGSGVGGGAGSGSYMWKP